jgi:hypothetical protein
MMALSIGAVVSCQLAVVSSCQLPVASCRFSPSDNWQPATDNCYFGRMGVDRADLLARSHDKRAGRIAPFQAHAVADSLRIAGLGQRAVHRHRHLPKHVKLGGRRFSESRLFRGAEALHVEHVGVALPHVADTVAPLRGLQRLAAQFRHAVDPQQPSRAARKLDGAVIPGHQLRGSNFIEKRDQAPDRAALARFHGLAAESLLGGEKPSVFRGPGDRRGRSLPHRGDFQFQPLAHDAPLGDHGDRLLTGPAGTLQHLAVRGFEARQLDLHLDGRLLTQHAKLVEPLDAHQRPAVAHHAVLGGVRISHACLLD